MSSQEIVKAMIVEMIIPGKSATIREIITAQRWVVLEYLKAIYPDNPIVEVTKLNKNYTHKHGEIVLVPADAKPRNATPL